MDLDTIQTSFAIVEKDDPFPSKPCVMRKILVLQNEQTLDQTAQSLAEEHTAFCLPCSWNSDVLHNVAYCWGTFTLY
jgi:hypothetical protein